MTTTITKATTTSFVKEIQNENGSFFRKLEKGTTEYSNACMAFHLADIALEIGNKLIK